MDNRQKISELEKENNELKELLEYYYGADKILEQAETILNEAIDAENELTKKAVEIDNVAFDKDHELSKRELRIEEREKETKKLLAAAQKKHKEAQAYIDIKAEEKISKARKNSIRIVVGITMLYSIILLVLYLGM